MESPAPVQPDNDSSEKQHKEPPTGFALFKPSYAAVLLNAQAFVVLLGLPIVLGLLSVLPKRGATPSASLAGLSFVLLVVSLVIYPALIITQLKSVRHSKISLGEAWSQSVRFILRFIGLGIILGVLFGLGFLLFIIPGIYLVSRYYLAPYHMIDKNLSITEAMKASSDESKGYGWTIWGALLVDLLIAILRVIPFLGWAIATVLGITYSCSGALCYVNIKKAHGGHTSSAHAA
jgi:hypothetical protein